MQMKPCPECNSDKVYRYKEHIEAGGAYGPNLLPKLASGMFSTARLLPVVCIECGYLRLYASKVAMSQIETSEHWVQL